MSELPQEIARDIALIERLDSVPTILDVLCNTTGMGFAVVAKVTENTWTACAVRDEIAFGMQPGGQLDVKSTLCYEVRAANKSIYIDHASADLRYCNHHTPRMYKIESYISVPIVKANGEYFGNLCALDPRPAKVSEPRVVALFEGFARLIAIQLDMQAAREKERKLLLDERAAVELREQFIAILGHDLRNPLQSISATAELLSRRFAHDDTIAGIGQRIRKSTRRMSALIDDVLDFARGKLGGGIAVKIESVDHLEDALVGVIQELQDGRPDRNIVLDVKISRPVRCDINRVQQLASNLIGNALTHGSPHSIVKVSVHETQHELLLEVWNDGDPIPEDTLDKIFDPFWRQTTSANRQGLGLGLHISSQISQAHGGRLSVVSSVNEGTRFSAAFPLS